MHSNHWINLPQWREEDTRMSFNLLPIVQNRYILVVSEHNPMMFDTWKKSWIRLTQNEVYPDLIGVQIGAFTLPINTSARHQTSHSNIKTLAQSSESQTREGDGDEEVKVGRATRGAAGDDYLHLQAKVQD